MIRKQVRAISKQIAVRRTRLRSLGLSNPRLAYVLRLQISQLEARRYGLTRIAAARGRKWARSYLQRLKRFSMYPYYQQIGLPTQSYAPFQSFYPTTQYYPASSYYTYPTMTSSGQIKAGYHPYIRGQVGAQVPSHLSRFGIGALSADDVEGIVEPIGLDGYGLFGPGQYYDPKTNPIGTGLAIGSALFLAGSFLSKGTKKKKQQAMTTGLLMGVAAIALTQHTKRKQLAGFGG